MNITRSNFNHTLPYVLECIRKSHFIAFDFEMTGISAHSLLRNSNLDSNAKLQLRYWKCKENTKRFLPIQMGLCPFEITNDKTVIARPFNFYIHPLPLEESIDRKFMCQASSMYFLSNYEFDFNKLFHDGIYYLSHEDAQVLENSKSIQKTKQKLREMSRVITPEMHAFSKLHLPKVEDFLDREDMPTMEIEIKFLKAKVYRHFETQVKNRWPHIPMTLTYDNESFLKRSKLIIKKVTQEELDAIKAAEAGDSKSDEVEEDIDPIGFRKIIDEISALKLPLIVHNGFLDIQHLYDKFFSTLPETNKEFKINFKKEFPILYDTKYMHNNSNVLSGEVGSHMDLTSCYKSILKYHNHEPKVELGPEFQEYQLVGTDENSAASHEAGYDAMVTGYVFFKSLGILNLYNSLFDKTFAKRMKFYENRLPLGGIKVPFNLNYEDDIYKDSSLVFYIHNEQAVLTFEQIKAYFEENFGQANLYQIYGDRLEYFMIFQKHESGVKLKTWLDSKSGETNIQMNTENGNALVGIKSFDKYEEKLKTKVRTDLDQYEMPKVFDIIG